MSWDDAERASKGKFIKLSHEGDRVVGVFLGEPCVTEQVWNDTTKAYEVYDPRKHVGIRPSVKYAMNFWDSSDGEVRVVRGNRNFFVALKNVRTKYGLDKWIFEVAQSSADPKKPNLTILPEKQIDAATADAVTGAVLHDLQALLGGQAQPEADDGDAIPF